MSGVCVLGDATLDPIRGEFVVPGRAPIVLTPMECDFVLHLARHHERVVGKEELLREVWKYRSAVRSRAVDATLIRVRAKLEGTGVEITSLHGRGLQLVCAPPTFTDPPVPRVADEPVEGVIGREATFAELERALTSGARPLVLLGPAGMGKTAVLTAWARRHDAARVELLGTTTAFALRRTVAAALDLSGEGLDGQIGARFARGAPVVLDHAECLEPDAVALFGSWLGADGAAVVLASQRRPGLPEEGVVVLPELDPAPARAVMQRARQRSGLPPLAAAQEDLLWAQLGGLPLALRVVAPLVEWLERPDQALEVPVDDGSTLLSIVARGFAPLGADALHVAHTAAAFASPPPVATLLAASSLPVPRTIAGLAALRLAGLATASEGRAVLLPVARTVLRSAWAETQRAHDGAFVTWLLALDPTHATLGPLRRELEWALHLSHGAERLEVLVRHLLMLLAFGPLEDLVPEAERWTATLPVELYAEGQEALAWACHAFGARHRARDLLLPVLDALTHPDLRARGAGLIAMYHAWWGEPDAAERAARAEALVPVGGQAFLRLDALTFVGGAWAVLDPERGHAVLERVIEEAGARFPARGLIAAISQIRGHAGSPYALDRARWLMGRVAGDLAPNHRVILDADLALCMLEAGETDEGWDRLQALRARHRTRAVPLANSLLMNAAMRYALVPERALALLADIDPTFSPDFASLIRHLADPAAPVDPTLAPFAHALRAGLDLPSATDARGAWVRQRLTCARTLSAAVGGAP